MPSSSIRGARPSSPSRRRADWGDGTTNRPPEYNALDDKYARVIVDELMPALYKDYNISKDPERHGIGGASSGAIAAFTVAWQRPDEFHKVLSIVGSFTNLRGGHVYPDSFGRAEKKPIRIFLQDGRNDNRGPAAAAPTIETTRLVLPEREDGEGAHREGIRRQLRVGTRTRTARSMGGPMLPEMMRWLWRDQPVSTDPTDTFERGFNAPKKETPR